MPNSKTPNDGCSLEPLISVIVPCHNCEDYIESCIESVGRQDYPAKELIVVEDSSTDSSWDLINRIQEQLHWVRGYRVSFRSPAKTRNFAIQQSRGNLIATLDADDYFLPSRLSKMHNFMNRSGADIVISDCFELEDNGQKRRFSETHPRGSVNLSVEDYLRFIMPAPPMFLANRNAIEQLDYYDDELKYLEDQDLFIRALHNGQKISYLNEPLYVHRLRPETLSDAKVSESLAWREAYRRHRKSTNFNARQKRIVILQILATTFRYYYFRFAPNLSWPKKLKKLRRVF